MQNVLPLFMPTSSPEAVSFVDLASQLDPIYTGLI